MGKRGEGYGSEHHFRDYRAHRADEFDRLLLQALGTQDDGSLEWIYPVGAEGEREPDGLAFLNDRPDVLDRWRNYWPQLGRAQTWDGIARLRAGSVTECPYRGEGECRRVRDTAVWGCSGDPSAGRFAARSEARSRQDRAHSEWLSLARHARLREWEGIQ